MIDKVSRFFWAWFSCSRKLVHNRYFHLLCHRIITTIITPMPYCLWCYHHGTAIAIVHSTECSTSARWLPTFGPSQSVWANRSNKTCTKARHCYDNTKRQKWIVLTTRMHEVASDLSWEQMHRHHLAHHPTVNIIAICLHSFSHNATIAALHDWFSFLCIFS